MRTPRDNHLPTEQAAGEICATWPFLTDIMLLEGEREIFVLVIGCEHLEALWAGQVDDVKMVFSDRGAMIFLSSQQHRDIKAEGISYEDNSVGNALAAMVRRDAIEIRYHKAFSDQSVARLIRDLLLDPGMARFEDARVTYQGRVLDLSCL